MPEETACLSNMSGRHARNRMAAGVAALAAALAAGAILILTHAHPSWRVALFAPFLLGFLGLLQAREKT